MLCVTSTFALTWEKKEAGENILEVEGECKGEEVIIYLYPKDSDEHIYSSGAHCIEGKFNHSDNLTNWQIEEGEYEIVVGDGQDKKDFSKDEAIEVKEDVTTQAVLSQNGDVLSAQVEQTDETPKDPLTRSVEEFSNSLKNMRASLANLRKNIDESPVHSQGSKLILSGMLGVLDEKIGGVEEWFEDVLTALVGSFSEDIASPIPLTSPIPTAEVTPGTAAE